MRIPGNAPMARMGTNSMLFVPLDVSLWMGIALEVSLSVGAESADALGFLPMPHQWRG
jgi:hypothetical protein